MREKIKKKKEIKIFYIAGVGDRSSSRQVRPPIVSQLCLFDSWLHPFPLSTLVFETGPGRAIVRHLWQVKPGGLSEEFIKK